MEGRFHEKLKLKIHEFITICYELTKKFPVSELYGVSSQLRRAAISVMLNYIEGYGRRRDKVKLNFYEITHGSTQECKYLIYFTYTQSWISKEEYNKATELVEEIAKMTYSTIEILETKIQE